MKKTIINYLNNLLRQNVLSLNSWIRVFIWYIKAPSHHKIFCHGLDKNGTREKEFSLYTSFFAVPNTILVRIRKLLVLLFQTIYIRMHRLSFIYTHYTNLAEALIFSTAKSFAQTSFGLNYFWWKANHFHAGRNKYFHQSKRTSRYQFCVYIYIYIYIQYYD